MNVIKKPKPKINVRVTRQQPLPILFEGVTGLASGSSNLWQIFTGYYNGDCVVVKKPEDMKALYTMGFFGKGSLSRNYPGYGTRVRGAPPIIKERQWKRRCEWKEGNIFRFKRACVKQESANSNFSIKSENAEDSSDSKECEEGVNVECKSVKCEFKNSFENGTSDNNLTGEQDSNNWQTGELLVIADSDSEDESLQKLNPRVEEINFAVKETLHLTLEEAFFLSYGLGCLNIISVFGNTMSILDVWKLFCSSQSDFTQKYIAYHHFRSKGWVVKPGAKYGGDFLLYKHGPPFYHSSYVVIVEVLNSDWLRSSAHNRRKLTWTQLFGLNRLAESVGKELLICQVIWPSEEVDEYKCPSPDLLKTFSVNEVVLKRWQSSQEREDQDKDEIGE